MNFDNYKNNPLNHKIHYALFEGNDEMIEFFIKHPEYFTGPFFCMRYIDVYTAILFHSILTINMKWMKICIEKCENLEEDLKYMILDYQTFQLTREQETWSWSQFRQGYRVFFQILSEEKDLELDNYTIELIERDPFLSELFL